jgi:hypothetical protein
LRIWSGRVVGIDNVSPVSCGAGRLRYAASFMDTLSSDRLGGDLSKVLLGFSLFLRVLSYESTELVNWKPRWCRPNSDSGGSDSRDLG